MHATSNETTFHGLNRDMWWQICLLLKPDDLLALSRVSAYFIIFFNNQKRRGTYFLNKARTELLPRQLAGDTRTSFKFFASEYDRHYVKPYKEKHPTLYTLMRLIVDGESNKAISQLDAYIQLKGDEWVTQLRDSSNNYISLIQIIAAKQDWMIFEHLYSKHHYSLQFTTYEKFTILSYCLYFGWDRAIAWILTKDTYQVTPEDLRQAIEGSCDNPQLFKNLLDRFEVANLEQILLVFFSILEFKKFIFLDPIDQYITNHFTPGFRQYDVATLIRTSNVNYYKLEYTYGKSYQNCLHA